LRPTNPIGLIVAIICVAACFVGIMMLLAVSSGTQRGGSGLGWGVLLVMSMIGGGMIPLFIMPNWMLKISVISPVRWSILAIEGGIWREFTFLKMAVPCGVLLGIGAACFAIGATVMSRRATA
jgi:ABC-2 type transport system permease protein